MSKHDLQGMSDMKSRIEPVAQLVLCNIVPLGMYPA